MIYKKGMPVDYIKMVQCASCPSSMHSGYHGYNFVLSIMMVQTHLERQKSANNFSCPSSMHTI